MTEGKVTNNTPWNSPWPDDGLEHLGQCPVCRSEHRKLLHKDIIDNVFFCAYGKWTLWRCANCESSYLDPRPTQDTIHLAYANYYTHQDVNKKDDYTSLNLFRKLRRRLVNGYTNWRYSSNAVPSSALGALVAFVIPSLKKVLDRQYRHMPRPPDVGGRLLDVGCGDGSFLSLARSCGWDVIGLDPDPEAATNAAKQGLTVYEGGIEYFDGKTELFDVITMCHVIEHVHDPVNVLKICHSLLKPGGQLWLETPNIDSLGHARFQENWRGLETPRHLVLFNRRSLNQAFVDAGFSAPHDCVRPSPHAGMFESSFAMEQGFSPYQRVAIPKVLKWQASIASYVVKLLPSRREFLTVAARKAVC